MQKNKHDRSLQPAINKSRTETLKNPGQSCFYSPVLLAMLMKILLPCRHSAPDMPLRFIGVKHLACLLGKGGIDLEEPFGDILMYRRFADPKLFCRSANRGAVFDDVHSQIAGSLLDVMLHRYHSPYSRGSYIWHLPGKYTRRLRQLAVVIFR